MDLRHDAAVGSQSIEPGIGAGATAPIPMLVARAKLADPDAFAALYRLFLPAIYGFVAARVPQREAAEDATQTIFFRALSSSATCRDNAAFPGWLFAIARNVVRDGHRRQRETLPPPENRDLRDDTPSPEDLAIQREEAAVLLAARERCLSLRDRELFDLLLTGLNDKQIATVLGRSHGAVRTAHYRLLLKLRKCLSAAERPNHG